jgi:hypothetical protein
MYILLENGMKIKEGDECLNDATHQWERIDGFLFYGNEYKENFFVPIRRRINTVEELFKTYSPSFNKTIEEAAAKQDNKPSAKCYSILCPAIWHNYCTSSKYNDCLDNQVE